MTRIQQQIFARGAVVGVLITITVIAADISGVLAASENWLYDLRARHFQFNSTKPTDQLVHVDIDDQALDVTGVGTWPWPRSRLAGILDEMRLAGVKAVALDILYSEPQGNSSPTTQPASTEPSNPADEDSILAAAIRKLGCVIVPAAASFEPPGSSPIYRAMVDALRKEPGLTEEQLAVQLAPIQPDRSDLARKIFDGFIEARKDAIFDRIGQEMGKAQRSRDELRSMLLNVPPSGMASPLTRAFNQQFDRWDSIQGLDRLGSPVPAAAPPLVQVSMQLPPLPAYVHAAADTGFVDYKPDRDGVLRSVPLLADHQGRLIPQMGLSLALLTLGLAPSDLQISEHSITLPRPGGQPIVIPVYSSYFPTQTRTIGAVFDIPWFGDSSWLEMYDWPAHLHPAQHIGVTNIWDAHETLGKILRNNREAAVFLPAICQIVGVSCPPTNDDDALDANPDRYSAVIDRVFTEGADWEKTYTAMPDKDLDQDGRDFLKGIGKLRQARTENPKLAQQLQTERATLAHQLGGKSVLIGRIATGYIDVVPTSIHPSAPGVIAHGVIFNAIMTGGFWYRPGPWVTPAVTLLLGLAAALLASWLSPLLGLLVTVLLGGGYIFFNGYFLFDRNHLLIGMAGPLTTLVIVWAGCTLNRILIEMGERTRITRRFSAYADPNVVAYVVENPDQVRFEGETRELTVVFTDLAGFTTISEKLGEATVPLLNRYFGRMVPIISANGGIVNKFLGDGIMCFYGAPMPLSTHAVQAVKTVLEMTEAVGLFNEETRVEGLPQLVVRAGISSGMMVVGDAGTSERSDYTVLGDIVNLGARLEGANKVTGTRILINDRTAELVRDQYLLRPIGALQVKGKEVWVMTYEPLALLEQASEQQKKLVQLTGAMVDAFIPGDFQQCLIAADKLEAEFGPSPLAEVYREQCRQYIEHPPEFFDGRIELTEK